MTHRLLYSIDLHTRQTFESMVEALDASPQQLPCLDFKPDSKPWCTAEFHPRATTFAGCASCSPARQDRQLEAPRAPQCQLQRSLCRSDDGPRSATSNLPGASSVVPTTSGSPSPARRRKRRRHGAWWIRFGSDRCFCLAGKTSLSDLLVLYGLADILVTNDSGPAHFASMTPIHCHHDVRSGNAPAVRRRDSTQHVLYAGLASSPCVNAFNNRLSPCTDNLAMKRISIDEVFDKAIELLDRIGQDPSSL